MNQQRDILKRIIDLITTIDEGLINVVSQVSRNNFSQAIEITEITLNAFFSIKQAIKEVSFYIEDYYEVKITFQSIDRHYEEIVTLYEEKEFKLVERIIINDLLNCFRELKKLVEKDYDMFFTD